MEPYRESTFLHLCLVGYCLCFLLRDSVFQISYLSSLINYELLSELVIVISICISIYLPIINIDMSNLIFLHVDILFSHQHLLNMFYFLQSMFLTFPPMYWMAEVVFPHGIWFYCIGLHVCFCVTTTLFLFLWLCNIFWDLEWYSFCHDFYFCFAVFDSLGSFMSPCEI